jgi:hypothetical protein
MFYALAYIEALYWLAFPLFLVIWCALACSGSGDSFRCRPADVRVTCSPRRYEV